MPALLDLRRQRFGRLVAIALLPREDWRGAFAEWICVCDCGSRVAVRSNALRSGGTKSCGCLKLIRARSGVMGRTHGRSKNDPTYRSWLAMHTRCRNPRRENYRYYGGRGIRVCERWASFEAFLADMGDRPTGLSLDRVDPDGHYEPSNCRWATRLQQRHNRSRRARLA